MSCSTLRRIVLPGAMTLMPFALRCQPSALPLASLPSTVLPVLEPETRMPWLLLLSVVFRASVDAVLLRRLMPGIVAPCRGSPAPVTVVPLTVTWSLPLT